MNKIVIILIVNILTINKVIGQEFVFVWEFYPFSSISSKISVANNGLTKNIQINNSLDSINTSIDRLDYDSLYILIKNIRTNDELIIDRSKTIRYYHQTKFLRDTNWILIDNDSFRIGSLSRLSYFYDKDSDKYYNEMTEKHGYTDGNNYTIDFMEGTHKIRFEYHSAEISDKAYEINKFICRLIIKYDKFGNYKKLEQMILRDKPKK